MILQISDYNKINEVLYVLYSSNMITKTPISKIGIQKILYLSAVLSPIKNIILSIVKFTNWYKGPYSKDIQNIIDHLVAYELIETVEFNILKNNNSIAYYEILPGGKIAVEKLLKYKKENEKYWWIKSIIKLAYLYSQEEELKDIEDFRGIDKIIKLVYEDPTFNGVRKNNFLGNYLDLSKKEGLTFDLIEYTKNYILSYKNDLFVGSKREIFYSELILSIFFEFLYQQYLGKK